MRTARVSVAVGFLERCCLVDSAFPERMPLSVKTAFLSPLVNVVHPRPSEMNRIIWRVGLARRSIHCSSRGPECIPGTTLGFPAPGGPTLPASELS